MNWNNDGYKYREVLRKPIYKKINKNKNIVPLVIKKSEIDRMKSDILVEKIDEFLIEKQNDFKNRLKKEEEKIRLKQLKIEKERQELLKLEKEYFEPLKKNENQKNRNLLKEINEENTEEVKIMNQFVNDARCAQIRKKQMEEKRKKEINEFEQLKKIDIVMEMERLKKIKIENEKVIKQKKKETEGKEVIIRQIEGNYLKRLKEKQIKCIEAEKMLKHMKKLQIDNEEMENQKMIAQKKRYDEIKKINDEDLERKKLHKIMEKDEDEKIVKYMQERILKEEKLIKQKKNKRLLKEREIAEIRRRQEKLMSMDNILFEIRMKRVQQNETRALRIKENEQNRKKKETNNNLKNYHKKQINNKKEKLKEFAERDKFIFERLLELKKIELKKNNEKMLKKIKMKDNYVKGLKNKMKENISKKNQELKQKEIEGKKIRSHHKDLKEIFLRKKKEKIELLKSEKVDDKYQTDLKRIRFFH